MMTGQEVHFHLGHLNDYSAFLGNGVKAPHGLTAKSEWVMEFLRSLTHTDRLLKKIREDQERLECEEKFRMERLAASRQRVLDSLTAKRKQLMRRLEAGPAQMDEWLKGIAKIDQMLAIIKGANNQGSAL